MRALREADAFGRVATVGLDPTEETRSGLIDGVLGLVLSHALRPLAEAAVDAMLRAVGRDRGEPQPQSLLPFGTFTPENV